jgi:hypothetical protein
MPGRRALGDRGAISNAEPAPAGIRSHFAASQAAEGTFHHDDDIDVGADAR